MKKVTFILPNLNGGGAERVALNFLRLLDNKNYMVTLVLFDRTKDLEGLLPPNIDICNLGTIKTSGSFFKLVFYLKRDRPDYVFTTHSRVAFLLRMAKPLAPRFTHIARMQNNPQREKVESAYGLIRRLLYSIGFKGSDVVIAQTEEMKTEGHKVFGIPLEKIMVMANPIDKKNIEDSAACDCELFPEDEFSVVAAGRLNYQKGFDVLLNALPQLIEEKPNTKLHILGDDRGHLNDLSKIVNELSLHRYVVFHGFVDNPYPFYKQCDLFVLSSRYEGSPNALIENYYLNTPLVSTRCASVVSDLIEEGVNGCVAGISDVDSLGKALKKTACTISRREVFNEDYKIISLENAFLRGAG